MLSSSSYYEVKHLLKMSQTFTFSLTKNEKAFIGYLLFTGAQNTFVFRKSYNEKRTYTRNYFLIRSFFVASERSINLIN